MLVGQYLFIQPLVELNSDNLFEGVQGASNSSAHLYYIFFDCLKVLLLIGLLPIIAFITKERNS